MASRSDDFAEMSVHAGAESMVSIVHRDTDRSDIVIQGRADSSDNIVHEDQDASDTVADDSLKAPVCVTQTIIDLSDIVAHKNSESSTIIVHKSTDTSDTIAQRSTEASNIFPHRNIDNSNITQGNTDPSDNITQEWADPLSKIIQDKTNLSDNVEIQNLSDAVETKTYLSDVREKPDYSHISALASTYPLDSATPQITHSSLIGVEGSEDGQSVSSLITAKNTGTSIPDFTPSRRSVRKKQSTFNDDFEYYTPVIKKKEFKFEQTTVLKVRQTEESQDDDDDGQISNEEEEVECEKRKQPKKKPKVVDSGESDEDGSSSSKRATKALVKKKSLNKGTAKKRKKKQVDTESEDEESTSEDEEKKVADRLFKKNAKAFSKKVVKRAKIKDEGEEEEETSDEEESTPISELRAQLKRKKEEEMRRSLATQGQSLMERFGDDSFNNNTGGDKSPGSSSKRKLSACDIRDEAPFKMLKSVQIDKLAPALANLMKLLPSPDRGLIKQTPSDSAARADAASNTAQSKPASSMKDGSHDNKNVEKKGSDSSIKSKMKIGEKFLMKKISNSDKTEKEMSLKDYAEMISKGKKESQLVKKVKRPEERLQHDQKMKTVTKVQIIRKPDGTIVKRKLIVPEKRVIREEDGKMKVKTSNEKRDDKKQLSGLKLQKGLGQKLKSPAGNSGDKKDISKDKVQTTAGLSSGEAAKLKNINTSKKINSEQDKKPEHSGKKVDDLLKRGIILKRKSHQPFGHKHVVRVAGRDLKAEVIQDVTVKQDNSDQKGNKSDTKSMKGKEQKRPIEARKRSSGGSQVGKGAKGKSLKTGKQKLKKSSSSADIDKDDDDVDPPTLTPVTAIGRHKNRHHKTEHEAPVDMSMMDLFKPDNLAQQDLSNKEEASFDDNTWVHVETKSQYPENTYDLYTFVKPENLSNIRIDHQYSKPASPSDSNTDDQMVANTSLDQGRSDDIESISHKKADFMDASLPDQILDELTEPAVKENTADSQDAWPDTREELQFVMSKRDAGDRPSILESLDNELKESGTEFRIVGQLEVDRVPLTTSCSPLTSGGPKNEKFVTKNEKNFDSKSDIKKSNETTTKSSSDKSKSQKRSDVTESKKSSSDGKKYGSTDKKISSDSKKSSSKDRKFSTEGKLSSSKDGKYSGDDKKSNSKDRKYSIEDKMSSSSERKSSLEDRKSSSKDNKYSTENKNYSSKDRKNIEDKKSSSKDRKSSIDEKKSSSKDRKSSVDEKKSSSKDKRSSSVDEKKLNTSKSSSDSKKMVDVRQDSSENRKDKKKMSANSLESKQEKGGDEECDSGEEHRFKDDENDLDWEPNDVDTVYCICRKPHNNRFMICCDQCEEWFHGTCVGISRARGKEMEDQEEEYICPVCLKGEKESALDQAPTSTAATEMQVVKPTPIQKCVGRKCGKVPRTGSVYCSNECIMSHAQESLKAIRDDTVRKKTTEKQISNESNRSPSSSSKAPTTTSVTLTPVEVMERDTGKILTGSSAPSQKGLHRWLEQHPTFEVVQPHKQRSKGSSSKEKPSRSDKDRKPSSDKDRQTTDRDRQSDRSHDGKDAGKRSEMERQSSTNSQKSDNVPSGSRAEEKRDDGPNQIRINVRTALRDSLIARAQEADDILLTSNEIKTLAVTIEEELFSMFNDTGHKYRARYRSLVFNIKDQKNKGLFRKILTGRVKPYKLVQMSTEELASRELAKWREQASKHQLEMIEKTEQAALKESEGAKHVRKKTHKGEIEVEDEDMSILETRLEEKKDSDPEPQPEQIQDPVIDTTSQHRAHLFDLNCKVCTGRLVPGREEQGVTATEEKITPTASDQMDVQSEVIIEEEKDDYEKAEEIVKEALRTMQKMEESVLSLPKMVSTSPVQKEMTPPRSPKLSSRRERSSTPSSVSSVSSSLIQKRVVVRSPDSALQTGLEAKPKFVPTAPVLWKGFLTMLDVAKFFASAYRVSGPTDHITIPETIKILGRISPDQMWDYLSKIRQAGSKDLTVVRFIPGSDDEKVAYVHLYSYLNSRSRCGVASNPNKQVKDFYIVPLASYGKIPRTLLPFDGPGLEENRPHMLIGILVRQRGKHSADTTETSSTGSAKPATTSQSSTTSSSKKYVIPAVNRDPRLAKLAAREASPRVSPAESISSSSSSSSSGEVKPSLVEEYEPEYIPMPIRAKGKYKPVAEYIPTPTVRKTRPEKEGTESKKDVNVPLTDEGRTEKYHYRPIDPARGKKVEKIEEDDSDPYSPGKEAEPYSPGQEAAAEEPYDPADDSLMDDSDVRIISSSIVSSTTVSSSGKVTAPAAPSAVTTMDSTVDNSSAVSDKPQLWTNPASASGSSSLQRDADLQTSELVEKMACSNDPQEISSLMVMALSTAQSPQEQQRLLVELTRKVEDRKVQLVEGTIPVTSGDITAEEAEKVEGSGVSSSDTTARILTQDSAASPAVEPVGALTFRPLVDIVKNNFPEETVSSSTAPLIPSLTTLEAGPSVTLDIALQDLSSMPICDGSLLSSTLSSASSSAPSEPPKLEAAAKTTTKKTPRIRFSISAMTKTPNPLTTSTAAHFADEDTIAEKNLPKTSEKAHKPLETAVPKVAETPSQTAAVHQTFAISQTVAVTQTTAVPQQSTVSQAPDVSKTVTENPGGIPDALQALMNDIMLNSQFSSLQKRQTVLLTKEDKTAEVVTKPIVEEDKDRNEYKKYEDENETQKWATNETDTTEIIDNVRNLEQTCSDGGIVALTDGGSGESAAVDVKKESRIIPPSIDELLEKLKRGGFQFPIQKAASTDITQSSSLVSTQQMDPGTSTTQQMDPSTSTTQQMNPGTSTTQQKDHSTSTSQRIDPSTSSDNLPSDISGYLATTAASSSVSAAAETATSLSSTIALDTDPNRKNDLPHPSAFPVTSAAASGIFSSVVNDPRISSYRDPTSRPSDHTERVVQQDRDDRQFKPATPKNPLDPVAFPPLPGQPRLYPSPLPRSSLPLTHSPLHPRFPLPTPGQGQARRQPLSPGIDLNKLSQDTSSLDEPTVSDVDLRSTNRTQTSSGNKSPPLPSQPPPLMPPVSVNSDHYPHPSSHDTDNQTGRYPHSSRDTDNQTGRYPHSSRDTDNQSGRYLHSSSRDTESQSGRYSSSRDTDNQSGRYSSSRDTDHQRSRYSHQQSRDTDRRSSRHSPPRDRDYRSGRSHRSSHSRHSDYHKRGDDRSYHRH